MDDVCDYCNRTDFPVALIHTAVALLDNYLQRLAISEETDSSLPLKRLKQGDTEVEFAVGNVDLAEWINGVDITPIKNQLNVYRRVRAW